MRKLSFSSTSCNMVFLYFLLFTSDEYIIMQKKEYVMIHIIILMFPRKHIYWQLNHRSLLLLGNGLMKMVNGLAMEIWSNFGIWEVGLVEAVKPLWTCLCEKFSYLSQTCFPSLWFKDFHLMVPLLSSNKPSCLNQ